MTKALLISSLELTSEDLRTNLPKKLGTPGFKEGLGYLPTLKGSGKLTPKFIELFVSFCV